MIRFNCPHCGRLTEVPEALAKLPLMCKQCGQRIVPASIAPAPAPPPPAPPPAKPQAAPVVAPKPEAPAPKPLVVTEKPKPAAPAPAATAPAPTILKPPAAPASPPPAPKAPPPAPKAPPTKPQAAPVVAPASKDNDTNDDGDVLVAKPDSTPDIDFNIGGPTAASLSDAARARPAGLSDASRQRPTGLEPTEPEINLDQLPREKTVAPVDQCQKINLDLLPKAPPPPPPKSARAPEPELAPEPKSESNVLPFIADVVVFLLLLAVGVLVGEQLVGKSSGQVLSEAGAAPKFPPIDLLLWGGPPLMFGLVYLLLNSRELTVGAWVRRRRNREL